VILVTHCSIVPVSYSEQKTHFGYDHHGTVAEGLVDARCRVFVLPARAGMNRRLSVHRVRSSQKSTKAPAKNARGIVGFEALLEYGDGGVFALGQLTGEGSITLGIFIRKIQELRATRASDSRDS
jgi:hypothetical protein